MPAEYRREWGIGNNGKEWETPAESPKSVAAREYETKETKERAGTGHIIPCHPVDSQVNYQEGLDGARNQPRDRDAHHLPQPRHHEVRSANDGHGTLH